ncbi:MAG: hypothetical protein QGH76_00310 [Phycisphaerales bacterium]|nr:hypothetical protein [Phycisphaerales bacterium]
MTHRNHGAHVTCMGNNASCEREALLIAAEDSSGRSGAGTPCASAGVTVQRDTEITAPESILHLIAATYTAADRPLQ